MRLPIFWSFPVFAIMGGLASQACKSKDQSNAEQDFVAREVSKLEAALAKRSESGVFVGCAAATVSLERMTKPLADQIRRLCYIEAPRLYLENAVADARKHKAEHPELAGVACMQLFAADAFKVIRSHPSEDRGLKALVDDYAALCPDQVATFRAR